MMNCEVLLMLGTDFPYRDFYPKDATIVQIDVRGEQLGRRSKLDFGFIGDTQTTLRALLPKLEQNQYQQHLKDSLEHYRKTRKSLDDLATGDSNKTPIHPQYVARVIDKLASDDAIFSCDVGTPSIWAARYLTMNGKRRLLGSFNHGSMANALPQAIGAQAAYPGRQVISLSGDGGLAMLLGELLTIAQYQLPVKIVLFDNHRLGMVQLEQEAAGLPHFGVELKNPNFAALAKAVGLTGLRVEDPAEVRPALERALATEGPVLVDVVTDPNVLAMPPKATVQQAKGFALAMTKMAFTGEADDVLDTVMANWRNMT